MLPVATNGAFNACRNEELLMNVPRFTAEHSLSTEGRSYSRRNSGFPDPGGVGLSADCVRARGLPLALRVQQAEWPNRVRHPLHTDPSASGLARVLSST